MKQGRRRRHQIAEQIRETFKTDEWMKRVDYLRALGLSDGNNLCLQIHERMGLIETKKVGHYRMVRPLFPPRPGKDCDDEA